jgi:hypothetical protein
MLARLRYAFSLLVPRTRVSLLQAFRDDRFLGVVTLVLFGTACVPLFVTPILPFSDLGANTASAELMWDTLIGRPPASIYYQINWSPVPYWVGYGSAALLGRLFGPLIAAKLLTAFVFALLPLSTMRLMLSLGRDPRLGLWSFALVWQQNLFWGWLAFMLGVALVSFVLAWIIEARSVSDGFRIAPYGAVVALTHVQATWLLALCGGLLCLSTGRFWKRVIIHLAAGSGAALMTLLWLVGQLSGTSGSGARFQFGWHSPAYRLANVFHYVLDNYSRPYAERIAVVAFVVLVLGPLALTQLPQRPFTDRRSPLLLVLVAGCLYALLWFEITGPIFHWYTYPRYAAVVALWLPLIPAPRKSLASTFALLPGIATAFTLNCIAVQQFAGYGERVRPFLDIIRAVPPGASVLPFTFDDHEQDPDLKHWAYHLLYGYISAVKHGYTPYLWDMKSHPFSNSDVTLPAPGWSGVFSMDEHGRHYDYLLVQGFQYKDPVERAKSSKGYRARLVLERSRWRLYAVSGPQQASP